MIEFSIVCETESDTAQVAAALAPMLRVGDAIMMKGSLAGGKTTFVQALVAALGSDADVTSPTFTLVHVYGALAKVYHADLYRIENFHDFETLGLEDVFEKPAVVILEWAERFPLRAPWPQVRVRLEHLEGDRRRLTVVSGDGE